MLTELVKRKISLLLPETVARVFDGWSDNGTHFMGVVARFPVDNKRGYSTRLLTLSPTSLDTNEHFDFLTYILDVYQKSCSNVIAIIGDNCNTNKALSSKTKKPLIGRSTHRFDLAMRNILANCANALIVKLRGLLLGAKLKKLTHIKSKTRNLISLSP